MTSSTCAAAAPTAPVLLSRGWKLSPRAAFYLQASITTSFLIGSAAPTPIYPLYQAAWGFSPVTVAVIFGIYAIAVLAALLVAGRLSDHIGRRPVLLAAALVQIAAMAVLTTADGLSDLLIGRVIQGLSAGAAVAAVGAGLIDLDRVRGTIANSIAPIMGTALGGLGGGLMVHFLPAPTHLVYVLLGGVFALQALGVWLMPESVSPLRGAWASLKPQFAVPAAARGRLWLAIPVLIAAWSLAGFYASLGPALVKNLFGFDASLFGGLALFVLAGSGALAVLLMRNQEGLAMMRWGASGLFVGAGMVLGALSWPSVVLFFIGSAVAGAGFGVGFQGAIRMVMPFAAAHERAGLLSVMFVVSYLAMGVPAVLAALFVAHGHSLLVTAQDFGALVMVLAALAVAGTRWARSR